MRHMHPYRLTLLTLLCLASCKQPMQGAQPDPMHIPPAKDVSLLRIRSRYAPNRWVLISPTKHESFLQLLQANRISPPVSVPNFASHPLLPTAVYDIEVGLKEGEAFVIGVCSPAALVYPVRGTRTSRNSVYELPNHDHRSLISLLDKFLQEQNVK